MCDAVTCGYFSADGIREVPTNLFGQQNYIISFTYFGALVLFLLKKGLWFDQGRNVTIPFCRLAYHSAIHVDEIIRKHAEGEN